MQEKSGVRIKQVPIAIVSPNKKKYSETFIRSQMQHLPAEIHYFYGGYLPEFYNDGNSFFDYLGKENILTHKISSFFKKIDSGMFIHAISKYCKKNNIKAILTHYGPTGLEMLPVCRKAGIPLFVYFHGYDVYRKLEREKFGTFYPELISEAAAVFAVSQHMVEELKNLGANGNKIVYNPCGADTDIFRYHDASINPPVFLSVGRFDDTKNHELTIKAFALVADKFPEARIKIAGEGKNLEKCKKIAAYLKLNDKVIFTGALNHLKIADEMSKARAFVLHSVTTQCGDKEGAPVSIMEAGASGLPVIATKHTGILDIVEDKKTGFLVNENDFITMAALMLKFCEQPLLAKEMGERAAIRINQNFSLQRNVVLLWSTMQKLMSKD